MSDQNPTPGQPSGYRPASESPQAQPMSGPLDAPPPFPGMTYNPAPETVQVPSPPPYASYEQPAAAHGQLQPPTAPYGYGAYGGYGYDPYVPEHPQATTVLILGILGLFVAVTGPFAVVIGNGARRDVAAGRYAPSTSLTVGWVLGIISTISLALGALGMVLFFIFGLAMVMVS